MQCIVYAVVLQKKIQWRAKKENACRRKTAKFAHALVLFFVMQFVHSISADKPSFPLHFQAPSLLLTKPFISSLQIYTPRISLHYHTHFTVFYAKRPIRSSVSLCCCGKTCRTRCNGLAYANLHLYTQHKAMHAGIVENALRL